MARDTWYRLDNIGKFYASQAGSTTQTVFRYAATLVDDVDPAILQQALDLTVDLFPSFNVCLRSGFFWHYLQQAPTAPRVESEVLPICYGLHVNARSVLFRVSYHGPRINFEVSHIVSDGRGSLSFFKALLSAYIEQRYGIEGVTAEYDGSDAQKTEDSFDKYFERSSAGKSAPPRAYHIRGWRDTADPTFYELHLPVRPVLDLTRSCGVSLTSLVIAALMMAIRDEMAQRDLRRAIVLDVPVDLRQYFPSVTAKNFFGLAYVSWVPADGAPVEGEACGVAQNLQLEDVARFVHAQFKGVIEPEHLKLRMNAMVALEKNPLLRFAPLLLKDFALMLADRAVAGQTTTTVSNLGAIRLDARLAPFVRDVNILTSTTGLNVTLCSFGDDLSIGISTVFSSSTIVKNFVRAFTRRSIPGRLNVNRTREEFERDRIGNQPELSLRRPVGRKGDQGRADERAGDQGRAKVQKGARASVEAHPLEEEGPATRRACESGSEREGDRSRAKAQKEARR